MTREDATLVSNLDAAAAALSKHYNATAKERAALLRKAAARIRELTV